jgi:hypothetical protein
LVCVAESDFPLLWTNYASVRARIDAIFSAINLTAAAFLDLHLVELEEAVRLIWSENADALLAQRLAEAGLGTDMPLAVRSSSALEDAREHSFAGLFDTLLNVDGLPDIKQAILQVWLSNFSRVTVLERVRAGLLSSPGEMTVIMQRMVDAKWAGVAFSRDPVSGEDTILIEATAGLGEQLVSGADEGLQACLHDGRLDAAPGLQDHHAMLHRIGELVEIAVDFLKGPADVEWAFDGEQVWLLQARPITTLGTDEKAEHPVFEHVPLYAGTDAELEPFKPLPDFAQYFRSKRKPLADFALAMGVPAGTSLLIRANGRGIRDDAGARAVLDRFTQPMQVLDFSRHIRQQMLPKDELAARLGALLRERPATFVVRDFVRGEAGLITQTIAGPHGTDVLIELSADGLLAINRGTADTLTFVVNGEGMLRSADHEGGASGLTSANMATLHRVTLGAVEHFGQAQLEWVISKGKLCLVDFSPITEASGKAGAADGRVISAGYASGKSIVVEATRSLEELSIAASVSLTHIPAPDELGPAVQQIFDRIRASDAPSIIVAPRPYAALASLVPYAAGFIFEHASTLCHLAILLREHGVPALGSRELYRHALTQSHVVVDTSVV